MSNFPKYKQISPQQRMTADFNYGLLWNFHEKNFSLCPAKQKAKLTECLVYQRMCNWDACSREASTKHRKTCLFSCSNVLVHSFNLICFQCHLARTYRASIWRKELSQSMKVNQVTFTLNKNLLVSPAKNLFCGQNGTRKKSTEMDVVCLKDWKEPSVSPTGKITHSVSGGSPFVVLLPEYQHAEPVSGRSRDKETSAANVLFACYLQKEKPEQLERLHMNKSVLEQDKFLFSRTVSDPCSHSIQSRFPVISASVSVVFIRHQLPVSATVN